jgi:hypothetical protein
MSTPRSVADFDSATGLVRALAAALHDQPHLRLGRSRLAAAAVASSGLLPERARTRVFAYAGGREAIPPKELSAVDPEAFSRWVVSQYGPRRAPAVAVGSSNGAVMHLCAAAGLPWLPQTFLVPVRRNSTPDDCTSDAGLAAQQSRDLLARRTDLHIHQMHDPNQDRLMVTRLAYFRMKLGRLTAAYRDYLRSVLPPGGTIVVVNCSLTWPVTRLGARHVYQHGAVGGLAPEEYVDGSPRVAEFLERNGSAMRSWRYPPVDGDAPEAEWGFEPALSEDVAAFADEHGYRVVELRFDHPDTPGSLVADVYREWFACTGEPSQRLLAETFICVEPTWALGTRTVPLWLSFGTEPALRHLENHLDRAGPEAYREVLVTLFAHGVRSAGYAPAPRWLEAVRQRSLDAALAGVRADQWPADFATLVNYSRSLHRRMPTSPGRTPTMPFDSIEHQVAAAGPAYGVEWRVW